MRLPPQITQHRIWPHLPLRTIRMRLALFYWVLFLASGAALLAVTVGLWQQTTGVRVTSPAAGELPSPSHVYPTLAVQHGTELQQLLVVSGIALAVMAGLSIALSLLVADRVLRPLRAITTTARDISATNLHERLNLAGPDDELKELGDTFDELLNRLDRSFQFERRFVANASHELRTPLATMRTSLDVAMAKPGPIPPQTITLAERLRPELDHIDRLLESFLTLAQTQQGPVADESTLSLGEVAYAAIERRSGDISRMGLEVARDDGPDAWVRGSATLLSRMIENVIDNAVKHNRPGGWVRMRTAVEGHTARLIVENGGSVLRQEDVKELAQPFRRLGADRTGSDRGTGLGLSIVESIAEVHSGTLDLHALSDGGIRVVIALPLAVAPAAGGGA
jgi:signal transduction histidine kinase